MVLENTLESPLDCKEIQPVHPKGDQSWVDQFIGRTDAEAEVLVLWPPHAKLTHWKRPWCWERLRAGGEGYDRGCDGWMASLTQWTWVWVDSGSWWWTGRTGVFWSVVTKSQIQLSDWTELILGILSPYVYVLNHLSHAQLFVILWTVAWQAPLSMEFSRQEYWGGLPFPTPVDLPNPGIEPAFLTSPALARGFFTSSTTSEAHFISIVFLNPRNSPIGGCWYLPVRIMKPAWVMNQLPTQLKLGVGRAHPQGKGTAEFGPLPTIMKRQAGQMDFFHHH